MKKYRLLSTTMIISCLSTAWMAQAADWQEQDKATIELNLDALDRLERKAPASSALSAPSHTPAASPAGMPFQKGPTPKPTELNTDKQVRTLTDTNTEKSLSKPLPPAPEVMPFQKGATPKPLTPGADKPEVKKPAKKTTQKKQEKKKKPAVKKEKPPLPTPSTAKKPDAAPVVSSGKAVSEAVSEPPLPPTIEAAVNSAITEPAEKKELTAPPADNKTPDITVSPAKSVETSVTAPLPPAPPPPAPPALDLPKPPAPPAVEAPSAPPAPPPLPSIPAPPKPPALPDAKPAPVTPVTQSDIPQTPEVSATKAPEKAVVAEKPVAPSLPPAPPPPPAMPELPKLPAELQKAPPAPPAPSKPAEEKTKAPADKKEETVPAKPSAFAQPAPLNIAQPKPLALPKLSKEEQKIADDQKAAQAKAEAPAKPVELVPPVKETAKAPASAAVAPIATPAEELVDAKISTPYVHPELGAAHMSIGFKSTETSVPLSITDDLDGLASLLKKDEQLRVTLIAYATNTGTQASMARRTSLARALSVRSYLIDQGVGNLRIILQAEGDKNPGGDPDRVDVYLVSPAAKK